MGPAHALRSRAGEAEAEAEAVAAVGHLGTTSALSVASAAILPANAAVGMFNVCHPGLDGLDGGQHACVLFGMPGGCVFVGLSVSSNI